MSPASGSLFPITTRQEVSYAFWHLCGNSMSTGEVPL